MDVLKLLYGLDFWLGAFPEVFLAISEFVGLNTGEDVEVAHGFEDLLGFGGRRRPRDACRVELEESLVLSGRPVTFLQGLPPRLDRASTKVGVVVIVELKDRQLPSFNTISCSSPQSMSHHA